MIPQPTIFVTKADFQHHHIHIEATSFLLVCVCCSGLLVFVFNMSMMNMLVKSRCRSYVISKCLHIIIAHWTQ